MSQFYTLPLLPLRGLNAFPEMLLSFDVERPGSVAALNLAGKGDQTIFLAAQKDISVDLPEAADIYEIGTVCRIRQQLRQPRGNICRVMVEGLYRAKIVHLQVKEKSFVATVEKLEDTDDRTGEARMQALLRTCINLYEEYINLNPENVNEQILNVIAHPEPGYVSAYLSQNIPFPLESKQQLLEERSPAKRLAEIAKLLRNEINIVKIEKELNEATQEQMNRAQRDYYLREELKVIQSELGDDGSVDDFGEYREKINALGASDEVKKKLLKELSRLQKQPFGSSEAAVLRSYLDVCLEIPWGKKSDEVIDVHKAARVLDDEHYGLKKVKSRIIEYLAVKQLTPEMRGGLICLVGPPGTGKTSIATSVAHALNRKLVRISLGGVHDEAEIRGHRKTYIGSMPGRIMNGIIQGGTCNPVMVLDEIDKLGSDYRGDPSAALLEALDGEQNYAFRDHFLELPFDLSDVFFITTANSTDTIPRPLLDRMEVIELSSYTDEEKLQIAKQHLIPKQRKKHGLNGNLLRISDEALRELIRSYTRESGVRILERQIATVCRKAAAGIAAGELTKLWLKGGDLEPVLGPVKYKPDEIRMKDEIGLVRGLAWTSVGGEVLDVEVAVLPGSGKLQLTGNLGDVMKESVNAALTYVRSRASALGISDDFYLKNDIHVHFPEGAVPKDGPSAGITICMALISALTGRAARHDVAMTGEITIRGKILAIGGLKEKTMAAYRDHIRTVIIPEANVSDLAEIDPVVRANLKFIPTDCVDRVLDFVLAPANGTQALEQPVPVKDEGMPVRQ